MVRLYQLSVWNGHHSHVYDWHVGEDVWVLHVHVLEVVDAWALFIEFHELDLDWDTFTLETGVDGWFDHWLDFLDSILEQLTSNWLSLLDEFFTGRFGDTTNFLGGLLEGEELLHVWGTNDWDNLEVLHLPI